MNAPVILHADATPSAPALVLRPWREADVGALVEAFRDSALRRWTSSPVGNEADAVRWVRRQEQDWAAPPSFPREGHLHIRRVSAAVRLRDRLA